MKRARLFTPLFCAAALWIGTGLPALAADGLFDRPADTDVARAWLDLLFRGIKLPDNLAYDAPNLGAVAAALHRALGVYSVGILAVAGLLLFYNIAMMVVETAHTGIPLGRRSAQVWAPLRLLLAIGFLVPVSGGLNAGQYLVAWMAEEGSSLASHIWETAADGMKGSFSGITLPHGPNVAGFVAGGFEMELCRALYNHAFDGFGTNQAMRFAGPIGAIEKLPRSRFAEEIWQYSNRLHDTVPLCGAYDFAAARAAPASAVAAATLDRLNGEFADFSRAETDKLIAEAQALAQNNAPVFLGDAPGPGVHDDLAALIAAHQSAVDERLHALIADDPGLIDETLTASADAGWITAGGFLLELGRLQELYGTLAAHALPAVQTPVLAESGFLHPALAETIATDPSLRSLSSVEIAPLAAFYDHVAAMMRLAHAWLYDHQLADMPMVLANPFDLRDHLNAAGTPDATSSFFAHVLNDGAIAYGVWNNGAIAPGSPVAVDGDRPLLALPSMVQNALTALAEFGQRQMALGNYLFGMAGPDIAPPGALVYALLLGAAGLGFMASGFALMFLIPLLPFLRFFIGILTWLLSVFEAIIAIPIVALAHLNFTGEGLSGGAAWQAYLLWLTIIVRPALTLFGLIMGLLLFTFAVAFLDMIFHHLMHLAVPGNGGMFVTMNVALTFLYTVLACAAANAAFKGINLLPDLGFKWLGGLVAVERAEASLPAAANPHAPGLAHLSTGNSYFAPNSVTGERGGGNRLIAAAKAYGLKMALFPVYHGGEKTGPEPPKTGATVDKQSTLLKTSEPFHVSSLQPHILKHPDPRPLKKPAKRDPDNVGALGKETAAQEDKPDAPPAEGSDPS